LLNVTNLPPEDQSFDDSPDRPSNTDASESIDRGSELDGAGADGSRVFPLRGRIKSITGRLADGGQPGMTSLDHLALELPDGRTVEFVQPLSGERATLEPLATIRAMSFQDPATGDPICPICLGRSAPLHDEHVPQTALGGSVMTMTCQRCNNELGSRVEVDLQHWFDHELVNTKIEHAGEIPGRRSFPRVHYRPSADGETFMMWAHGPASPEIEAMLKSGTWNVNFRLPDANRRGLALLKHAYLAACLHLHNIPDAEDARAIRADLLAARDTPRRATLPSFVDRLLVYRGGIGRQGPPLALARMIPPDGGDPQILISLAGVLFVSWPFEELPPEVG